MAFILNNGTIEAAPGTKIVRHEELLQLMQAQELIDQSRLEAQKIVEEAQKTYDERFEQGLQKGREEGRSEYSLKIMDMVIEQLDSLEGLEKQIVEVTCKAVEKIIGQFDGSQIAVRIVHRGLNAVRGEKRILVRVSLQDEAAVREELRAFLLSADGSQGYIEVMGDPNLNRGDCILETAMGVVEAGLNTQLKNLRQALSSKVAAKD